MELQDPHQKIKYYLCTLNDMICIGKVLFSIKKLQQKNIKPMVMLQKFYLPHYIEKFVPSLFRRLVKDKYQEETMNNIQNPYKQFRLEAVFQYQFWMVQRTLQEKFVLKMSEFRISLQHKAHSTFCEDSFWQIKFPHLKHLSLSDSEIFSVEGLSHCVLPVLQKLQLHKNKITNLSILSKLSFRNLKQLTTYQNPVSDLNEMKRLHAPSIQFLDIDEQVVRRNDDLGDDQIVKRIDFILKSQSLMSISEFQLRSECRILPKWYEKTMKQINGNIKLFTGRRGLHHHLPFRDLIRIRQARGPPQRFLMINYLIEEMEEELPQINAQQRPLRRRRQ